MKIALTIIFSTLTLFASGQKDLIKKKWIAILSEQLADDGIFPLDGVIFDITNKRVTVSYPFSDSLRVFEFNGNSNRIEIDEKYFGDIRFVSKDSLILDFNKTMRTKFVPVEDFKPELDSINLARSSWVWQWFDGDRVINRRIDFTDIKWNANDGPYVAMIHQKGRKYKYQENEKWFLKEFHDEWFLTLTQDQIRPITFQVIGSYPDSLKLRCLSFDTKWQFALKKLKKLDQTKVDSLVKYLTQKKWETSDVLSYVTSFSEAPTAIEEEFTTGFYVRDTTLIKRSDLVTKKVSFAFRSDFVYQLFVDSKIFLQTTWRLSDDGRYVIISDGQHPYDYIEIFSTEEDGLVIGKSDNFATDDGREYFPYYYEVKLR